MSDNPFFLTFFSHDFRTGNQAMRHKDLLELIISFFKPFLPCQELLAVLDYYFPICFSNTRVLRYHAAKTKIVEIKTTLVFKNHGNTHSAT